MALDDPPRDGQPQPGALVLRGLRRGCGRTSRRRARPARGRCRSRCRRPRSRRRRRWRRLPTVTRGATPGAVYLIALPSRLRNTRCSWPGSARSDRQLADLDHRAALGHRGAQVAQRGGDELARGDALDAQVGRPGPRIEQQVVDHALHALDAVDRVGDELPRAVVQAVAVLALEQRHEARRPSAAARPGRARRRRRRPRGRRWSARARRARARARPPARAGRRSGPSRAAAPDPARRGRR